MKIIVNGQEIRVTNDSLYSHSKGIIEVEFEFDDSWDGWNKVAVFQLANEKPVAVELSGDSCVMPELNTSGKLKIGIYGTKDDKVMPTKWIDAVKVSVGTPIIEAE